MEHKKLNDCCTKKRRIRTRTKFTFIAIINITWFTMAVLVLSALNKTVPDSLIVAFFAAWTCELALLYGIKIKDKGNDNDCD